MKKVHNEMPDAAASVSLEQYKKMLVISLIKLCIPVVLGVAVLCFASVAWFATNTSVRGNGMSVVASGPNYEISVCPGSNGLYYENYHKLVQDQSAIVWQMTETNNMENIENGSEETNSDNTSQGIHPGSYGVISFFVTPKVETVNLKFTFEVVGYVVEETQEGGKTKITMTALEQNSEPAKYLNGHLLLFGGRKPLEDGSSVFIYSDPILSNDDMKRVIASKKFKNDTPSTQVDIYWVWPRTLSTLVDARGCENVPVSVIPFTEGDHYQKIVNNILTYPKYYLKESLLTGSSTQGGEGENAESGQAQKLSLTEIVTEYQRYGDYYDQADNDIGMGIDFVLLKLSVEEADSSGG